MSKNAKLVLVALISAIIGTLIGAISIYYFLQKANISRAALLNISGSILYGKGDLDSALPELFKSTALNPDDYSPYYLIGDIYLKQNKRGLALKAYETALDKTNYWSHAAYARNEDVVKYDVKKIQTSILKLKEN